MYITSYDELQRALSERRKRSEEVRESVNRFVNMQYGIEDFMGVTKKFFPFMQQDESVAILARQIASVCAEDIAFETGACQMNLRPVTVSFTRDAWSKNNHDKLHRVKIPWIFWSKKNSMILEYKRICIEHNDKLDGMPLDQIVCLDGNTLPEYHMNLRTASRVAGVVGDVSSLHTHLLQNARNRPQHVFRENEGRESKHTLLKGEEIAPRDRPPASWYYPYYLSWFMDGSMVLFETYDNPIGDVSHAKSLFEQTVRDVTLGTGFTPLIVKIPPLSKEMLYCNQHFQQSDDALSVIKQLARQMCMDNTVTFFQTIANEVIRYR